MSRFGAGWLALREPVDARARSRDLLRHLPSRYPSIVDLGAGTGANLRWLAPRLEPGQHWILLDHDAGLLAAVPKASAGWAATAGLRSGCEADGLVLEGADFECRVDTRRVDLSRNLQALDLPAGGLVTASALLDLVSMSWLEAVTGRVAAIGAWVYWALSYDGSVELTPAFDEDAAIIALLNRHQLGDKGFGPALGPDAWRVARDLLTEAGFTVFTADSSWRLGAPEADLVKELISGWAAAAAELAPADERAIRAWQERRLTQAATGQLGVVVGHRDLAAKPQSERSARAEL